MAVPKDKVAAALGVKYRGKSISKTLVNDLATDWAEKIEDEAGIDEYINNHDTMINVFIKEADRRATTAAEKARKEASDAAAGRQTDDQNQGEETIPTDAPDWFKQFATAQAQQTKVLTDKLAAFEGATQAKTIQERFTKEAKAKGVPDAWIKRSLPGTEADYDTALNDIVTDYTQFATENKLKMIGGDAPGGNGSGGGNSSVVTASKEEIAEVMKQL